MDKLKDRINHYMRFSFLYLHSNMDKLKVLLNMLVLKFLIHLHSNMDKLKGVSLVIEYSVPSIYIPIWIN